MRAFFLFLTLAVCSQTFAQVPYVRALVDSLCSDRYAGRGYVDQGDKKAALFLSNEMEEIGLSPLNGDSYLQSFEFPVNSFPGSVYLSLNGLPLEPGSAFIIDPHSPSGSYQGEVFLINHKFVKKKNWLEKLKTTWDGKQPVVIDTRKMEEEISKTLISLSYELRNLAPICLIVNQKLTWSVGRSQGKFPAFEVDASKLGKRKIKSISFGVEAKFIPNHQAFNVCGLLPGKSSDSLVVFSAHYDHLGKMGPAIFPGANDNASGTALVMNMARTLASSDEKLPYDVAFLLFAGEEAGLLGSAHFTQNPLVKLEEIQVVLNLDIMGTGNEGITVVNAVEQTKVYETLVKINQENQLLEKIKKRKQTQNSDHYWFSQNGVPAVFIYTLGGVRFYHDVQDRSETLPLDYTDEISNLLLLFLKDYMN